MVVGRCSWIAALSTAGSNGPGATTRPPASRVPIANRSGAVENPVTPSAYRVTGIPALKVFHNGQVVKEITGARPKSVILKELADFIG